MRTQHLPLWLLLWSCAAGAADDPPPDPLASKGGPPAPDAGAPAAPPEAPPQAAPQAEPPSPSPRWQDRPLEELLAGGAPPWLDLSADTGVRVDAAQLERLAFGPTLSEVRGLDLSGQPVGFEGAKALSATRDLPALVELRLSGCGLGDNGVRAIAYARHLPDLERLDLSGNGPAEIATEAMSEARYLGQLTHLDLRGSAPPPPAAARKLGEQLVKIEVLAVDAAWPEPVLEALREGLGDRAPALTHEAPAG